MRSDPFALLAEFAAASDSNAWILVGGLMVHCHAERAGIAHARPTDDADIVVELAGSTTAGAAARRRRPQR